MVGTMFVRVMCMDTEAMFDRKRLSVTRDIASRMSVCSYKSLSFSPCSSERVRSLARGNEEVSFPLSLEKETLEKKEDEEE
mgnify:CR=1 FL=1